MLDFARNRISGGECVNRQRNTIGRGEEVVPLRASQNLSVRVALRYGFPPHHRGLRCVTNQGANLNIPSCTLLTYNNEVGCQLCAMMAEECAGRSARDKASMVGITRVGGMRQKVQMHVLGPLEETLSR